MAGAQVALCYGQEACKAGLGSQHIVATLVAHGLGHPVANRQEEALRFQEKSEVHSKSQLTDVSGENLQPPFQGNRTFQPCRDILEVAFDRVAQDV